LVKDCKSLLCPQCGPGTQTDTHALARFPPPPSPLLRRLLAIAFKGMQYTATILLSQSSLGAWNSHTSENEPAASQKLRDESRQFCIACSRAASPRSGSPPPDSLIYVSKVSTTNLKFFFAIVQLTRLVLISCRHRWASRRYDRCPRQPPGGGWVSGKWSCPWWRGSGIRGRAGLQGAPRSGAVCRRWRARCVAARALCEARPR